MTAIATCDRRRRYGSAPEFAAGRSTTMRRFPTEAGWGWWSRGSEERTAPARCSALRGGLSMRHHSRAARSGASMAAMAASRCCSQRLPRRSPQRSPLGKHLTRRDSLPATSVRRRDYRQTPHQSQGMPRSRRPCSTRPPASVFPGRRGSMAGAPRTTSSHRWLCERRRSHTVAPHRIRDPRPTRLHRLESSSRAAGCS